MTPAWPLVPGDFTVGECGGGGWPSEAPPGGLPAHTGSATKPQPCRGPGRLLPLYLTPDA